MQRNFTFDKYQDQELIGPSIIYIDIDYLKISVYNIIKRVSREVIVMGILLNPENTDFQIALNSEIYVDKSELIRHTNKVINTE